MWSEGCRGRRGLVYFCFVMLAFLVSCDLVLEGVFLVIAIERVWNESVEREEQNILEWAG